MKRYILLGLFCVLICSCKKNNTQIKQPSNPISINTKGFELHGNLENLYPKKVYLNKIIENEIYPTDSSNVINNAFTFNGIVEFPERFALTFSNYSSIIICIIENTKIDLFLSSAKMNEPLIVSSPLNTQLNQYITKSKKIFSEIDYLFPYFQKARLENDVKKLDEIRDKMIIIEKKNTDFTFNFILQNKESYVAAMILRDQLKTATIDTLRIKKAFQNLSDEVKNSPDALIIASFLNLQ